MHEVRSSSHVRKLALDRLASVSDQLGKDGVIIERDQDG
jgi:hypothetical protein